MNTEEIKNIVTNIGGAQKIASKTGINAAIQAATNLTWETGINLSTHVPVFAVIKYASGTLGISIVRLLADTIPVTASSALLTIVTGTAALMPVIASLVIPVDNSKFLKADVSTASLGASTFDITVYGVPY